MLGQWATFQYCSIIEGSQPYETFTLPNNETSGCGSSPSYFIESISLVPPACMGCGCLGGSERSGNGGKLHNTIVWLHAIRRGKGTAAYIHPSNSDE